MRSGKKARDEEDEKLSRSVGLRPPDKLDQVRVSTW